MKGRLTGEHRARYGDPLAVSQGEPLTLTGREDIWEGHRWLWAVAPDGREGWVPDSLPLETPDGPRAARGYDAIELDCTSGEIVTLLRKSHGWAWCRKADGREGWLPLRLIAPA
jgi:hypothetical protein